MARPLFDPTGGGFGGPAFGPGGSPLPGGPQLPAGGETERIELLSLGLDAPVPLAYGRHFVGGTIIFEQENADGTTTLFIALGEGEWDAIEVLWVNGLPIDTADTSIVHFHPGLEGELGVESAPGTRNQKICSFLPTGFSPQLTFSRTAYLALKLKPDQRAPGPEFDIRGIFRSLRVRDFNAAGFTGYDYSTNPARIALDLLLRRFLLPRGLLNETVPSIVTDRLDFSAWNNWKTACDFDIGGGVKRWEASVAFVQGTDLLRALEWLLLLGRGYLLERNGQFAPFHDEDRAALLTAGRDEIAADSLRLSQKAIRSLANLYAIRYRALNSGNAPGTISTSGINVTGVDTDFTQRFKQDMLIDLRAGAQKGEARRVAADPSSDTTMPLLSAFSADQAAGTLYGNPGGDFQPQLRELADEDHQDQIGRIIRAPIDLGNSTGERAERLGAYLKGRGIDLRKRASFVLLPDLSGANDLLPGDVITGPADLDYASTRLWEILEISDEPDGRRQVFCQEFSNSIFTDIAGPQQLAAPALPSSLRRSANLPNLDMRAKQYHRSAARVVAATDRFGQTASGAFFTVASFSLFLPVGVTTYQGSLKVTIKTDPATIGNEQGEGRLKIGTAASNVISVGPGGVGANNSGTVTVEGLDSEQTVTVEIQARSLGVDAGQIEARFTQNEYEDQDASHFS